MPKVNTSGRFATNPGTNIGESHEESERWLVRFPSCAVVISFRRPTPVTRASQCLLLPNSFPELPNSFCCPMALVLQFSLLATLPSFRDHFCLIELVLRFWHQSIFTSFWKWVPRVLRPVDPTKIPLNPTTNNMPTKRQPMIHMGLLSTIGTSRPMRTNCQLAEMATAIPLTVKPGKLNFP
jgi:hypothetical protein